MKQIDILRHAKDYLEKLDAYTDPISGTRLPSSSAARDEYVHKSFYFSLKHMNHIISYDDTEDRPPFTVTPELLACLKPDDGARRSKQVVDIINRAVDLSRQRGLSLTTLQTWLTKQEYLRKDEESGHYLPTDRGQTLGIRVTNGRFSPYAVFDPAAQQFIFDHLEEIAQSVPPAGKAQRKRDLVDRPEALEKSFRDMELLSQGLHPVTQAPLEPQDPLGQERLRKCFAFVALAFQRSLAAGYFTAKAPFTLPRELWDRIPGEENLPMALLLKRINALLPDPTAVEPLSREAVRDLLVRQGLLMAELTAEGRKNYVPTPQGTALGILTEDRVDKDGALYKSVAYSPDAQRYLAEHMGELIAPAQ